MVLALLPHRCSGHSSCPTGLSKYSKVYMKAQVLTNPAEWGLLFGFSFVQTSNVIGAIWYFFAIERESACWKKAACLNHIACGDGSFHCDDHLGDYKFLNDLCCAKTQKSTNFNSGIFLEAFQSGILEKKDSVHKLYYCLRWGMQSVSSFGQGLQTSTNPWANIFIVCISISSMWLLVIYV